MTPAEVYQVESHYLQFKWPLNKMQNCGLRTHPALDDPSRLAAPGMQEMSPRIDDYDRDTRHQQGLASLAIQAGSSVEVLESTTSDEVDVPWQSSAASDDSDCVSIDGDDCALEEDW